MKIFLNLCVALCWSGCGEDQIVNVQPDFAMELARDMAMHTTGDAAISASVDVQDTFYAPRNVTISAGGAVTWTWRSSGSHTVTSDDNGATFDSSPAKNMGTFTHTFPTAGSYPYHCEIHGAAMTGTITVQ
jgi:plastocyanin